MQDNKELINSILLVNWYLINLQLDKNSCKDRKHLTRNYLTCKISKALSLGKKQPKGKAFSFNIKNYI